MDGEGVAEGDVDLAEAGGVLEQRSFGFGGGEFGGGAFEAWGALALLAVVMREQNPLDAIDADFGEVVENAAVAEVDQQRRVAVAEDVDGGGIGPGEEVGQAGVGEGSPLRGWHGVGGSRCCLPVGAADAGQHQEH